MGKTVIRWSLYYLLAAAVQIPAGLLLFLAFTSLGLVLPENLDTWFRRILWLVFFLAGFWAARLFWGLLLKIPGPARWCEGFLGQGWIKKAWL